VWNRKIPLGRVVLVAFALGLLAGGAGFAWAAPDKTEDLIRRGIDLRRTGDDQGAQPLFREAYDQSHAARAAAQLGFCEQALGRWPDAEIHLGEALRDTSDAWINKNRSAIEQALLLIKTHVARIEISGEPVGAEVLVNGKVVGKLPMEQPVRIAGGEIEIELRARGYRPTSKKVHVDGGQYQTLSLHAEQESADVRGVDKSASKTHLGSDTDLDVPPAPEFQPGPRLPPPTPTGGDASDGSGGARKSLKFVSWGLAAVSLGVGLYFVVDNRNMAVQFDKGCGKDATGAATLAPDAPPGFDLERCQTLKRRYEWSAKSGVIGIAGAVILTGAGVALWLTESEPTDGQKTSWRCVPSTTANGDPAVGCAMRF
jgi:hypothetical protein